MRSKRSNSILLAAAALLALATAPAAGQGTPAPPAGPTVPVEKALYQDGQKGRFLLDGTWYFRADPTNRGARQGFATSTSLAGWSPVTVPNAWNATDLSDFSDRGSVGWYRKDFILPRSPHGTSWIVRFESVNYRADVFLNGHHITHHEGAFIPFEALASRIHRGVNHLVVKVDNRRRATDIPPARDQSNGRPGGGWWNYGGLLREVYLRRVSGIDIQNLLARPILPCGSCNARVLLRATLANPAGRRKKVKVRASVGGIAAHFRQVVVPAGGTRNVIASVKVANPRLWEPGDPELYHVVAAAFLGHRRASEYDTDIGIRSIRVDGQGRMLLNGRPVNLRGASIDEEDPTTGMALTSDQIDGYVSMLQQLGANITRAHYPLSERLLEACDRLGILVWEQIPFNRERFGSTASALTSLDDSVVRSRAVRQKALDYVASAIDRDQNHPSVFAWSVANEPEPRPTGSEIDYFDRAIHLVRRMDPSRLVAVDLAGYPSMPQEDIYSKFQAVGLNSYFGWYPGPSGELDDRAGLRPFLGEMHDYFPHSALFVTEFGAEANRNGPIDEKGTYAFQDDLLNYHLDAYDADPFINGAIVWILKDFRVQPGWDGGNPKPTPPVLTKGLVDENGNRKPAFDDLARRFRDTPAFR